MDEPLLSYINTGKQQAPSPLCPLPENNEICIPPMPLTPSSKDLKDMLIFGSPSSSSSHLKDSSSNFLDALTASLASPRLPIVEGERLILDQRKTSYDPESLQSWLVDPNYPAAKSNLHRSKTAPAMATINELGHCSHAKPPQFGKTSIVWQGVILLIIYLSFGVIIYSLNMDDFTATRTHPVVDALYFCIVTMCTIGYGDITPDSTATKLFSITFVLVGFGFIDILLSGMVCYMLDLQENYLLKTIKIGGGRDARSYIIDVKKGRMRIRMKVALALGSVVLCIGVGVAVMHFVERLDLIDSFYLSVMSVTTVGYGDRAFKSMPGRIFASIWLLVSTLAVARAFLYLAELRVDRRHRKMAQWVLGQDMTVAQFLAADIDNNGFVTSYKYLFFWCLLACYNDSWTALDQSIVTLSILLEWIWFLRLLELIDIPGLLGSSRIDTLFVTLSTDSTRFQVFGPGLRSVAHYKHLLSKSEFVVYKLKEMGKVTEKDILQICKQFERLDAGNCGKITLADLMESHH